MGTASPGLTSVSLPNRDRWRIRGFLGGLLALIGGLDVIQALISNHPSRSHVLDSLLPSSVMLSGRTGAVLIGFALLLLARGVSRGEKVAWRLTLSALLVSIVFHIIKDLDFEEAALAAWVALGLVLMRHQFEAESDPAGIRRGLLVFASGIGLAVAYGLLGAWFLSSQLQPGFGVGRTLETMARAAVHDQGAYHALSARARWFLASLPWVADGMLLLGLVELLRPVLGTPSSDEDRSRLRALLEQWGHGPVCYLALYGPNSYFWADEQSCVAYSVRGRTALALGDPIAPLPKMAAAITAFSDFCDRQGWTGAFYQVEDGERYRQAGFRLVPIGSDAIIPTRSFRLEGGERAALRRAVHRTQRLGMRFDFLPGPQALEAASRDLQEVSRSWLAAGKGPEMSFSLGTLATLDDPAVTVGLARDADGRLQAFVSWLPVPARRGWALDLMRRRPDGVPGSMESLIVMSIAEARARGLEEVSLGLAPLAVVETGSNSLADRALRLAYSHLDRFRRSRSLRRFKAKFAPVWEERYLAVPSASALPEVLVALLRVHLPALSPVSVRLRLGRTGEAPAEPLSPPRAGRARPRPG